MNGTASSAKENRL